MALRDLFRRGGGSGRGGGRHHGRGATGPADPADLEHLRRWCATRVGVEAFLEPSTLVSVPGLCLVAFDGEWTRRPVGNVRTAEKVAHELGLPLFEVEETGYPQRMRDFEEARRAVERRARRERLREQVREAEER